MNAGFSLGKTVATRGVMDLLNGAEISMLLTRHSTGDWGDLCQEYKELNESALISGNNRLFSAYTLPKGKVWIITEYDRSITTVLLPDEY